MAGILFPLLLVISACAASGSSQPVWDKPAPPEPVTGDGAAVAEAAEAASGDDESEVEEVEPNGEIVEILAIDNAFAPEVLTISAGTEVLWTNRGYNPHNIVTEDPDQGWQLDGEDFEPTATFSNVFTRPGTFRYYCSIHGNLDIGMPGVIIVE